MMKDMGAAMRRALTAVRAQDPMAATREIQAALGGQPRPMNDGAEPDIVMPRRDPAWHHTAPEVEDAEIVDDAPTRPVSLLDRLKAHLPGCADCDGAPGTLSGTLPGSILGKMPGAIPEEAPKVPPGASFLRRSHAGPEGARDYRLYIPSCGAAQVRGLIVMLHGCTQTPEDFARGTGMNAEAEKARFAVAWPEQTRTHNMQSCWNWFETGHQSAARGEPAILAALTRALCAEFDVPPARCFVAGLSAGGAMAAILGESHPDLFGAIGVHSGLPAGAAQDMVSAFSAMRGQGGGRAAAASGPRLIVLHGDADRTVDVSNAHRIVGAGGHAADGHAQLGRGRAFRRSLHRDAEGRVRAECWIISGAGHAWSGGSASGSYTDPSGPDASKEMLRFFLEAAD